MDPEQPIITESKIIQLIKLLTERSLADKKIQSEYWWLSKALNLLKENKKKDAPVETFEYTCDRCKFWEPIKNFNNDNALTSQVGYCTNEKVSRSLHSLNKVPDSLPILKRLKDVVTASWFACKNYKLAPVEGPVFNDLDITKIALSVRALNCLKQADIKNLSDLENHTEMWLMVHRNMGEKTRKEIKMMMERYGIKFKNPETENPIT